MRILIFNTFYYPNIVGGAEKSTQLIAEGLVKKGLNISVVSIGNNKEQIINGVKVYYINEKFWLSLTKKNNFLYKTMQKTVNIYNPSIYKKINTILNKEKPSFIHTNNLYGFSPYVWKLAKNSNLPIVHTIRDHFLLCNRGVMFKNGKNCDKQCVDCKLTSTIKKSFSQYVDAVIGISEYILHRHLEYGFFNNAKIKTHIYNPVPQSKKFKKKKEIIFGYIGQLSKGKGVELLLSEFSKINNPSIKLYLYGKGIPNYEKYLKTKFKDKRIKFRGFMKSNNIYEDISISIIPSLLNEAFSRIHLESYSYGIPVIGSNRGGIPEGIIDKKTGFIFDPSKRDDLKEKMEIFINNPKLIDEFSQNCIKFVKNFDEEKIVNQYIDLYNKVLNNNEK